MRLTFHYNREKECVCVREREREREKGREFRKRQTMERRHFAKVSFLSAEFSRRQDSYPQVVWSSQGAEQSRGT